MLKASSNLSEACRRSIATRSRAMTTVPSWSAWRSNPASSTKEDTVMMKNQVNLPKLPVPPLSATMKGLLASCKPLARSSQELNELEKKIQSFQASGELGEKLQKRLEARREQHGMRNWIAEWWDHDAYMSYRDSVVVNVSYYYGFDRLPQAPPNAEKKSEQDPAYVAASIVQAALVFRSMIAKGLLVPEPAGKEGGELCMESYKWAFNACRVPAKPADYAVKVAETDPTAQFIVAIRQNRFWEIPLINSDTGKTLDLHDLKRAFQSIYAKDGKSAPGVGILTGINRDRWTDARTHLLSSPGNILSLEAIEKSAFVVSLDEARPDTKLQPIDGKPSSSSSESFCKFSEILWKAGGKGIGNGLGEAANRWWDKPLQWIVFDNGEAGIVGEHSCMDGTPTARMADYVSKALITNKLEHSYEKETVGMTGVKVKELVFDLDDGSLKAIESAKQEFSDHVRQYDLYYHRYGRYGKDGIKKMGVSPDGWTQMIFQLAYRLTHGKACGTYEAAQVRRFQLGRTETVRICTEDSAAWTTAMLDTKASNEDRIRLFREAVKTHGTHMKNASAGMGLDRHLFGLKHLVQEGETADLFADPLLQRSSTWNMSTSQIYIRHAPAYGWGPVVRDGYGIPYMIHPECLQFSITCHESMPGQAFIDNIGRSADMLMDLMQSEHQQAKL